MLAFQDLLRRLLRADAVLLQFTEDLRVGRERLATAPIRIDRVGVDRIAPAVGAPRVL